MRKPRTIKEKKAAIRPWKAKFDGKCPRCGGGEIKEGQLVCRSPESDAVIHYSCHPDWRPAPFPGYDYRGRKIKKNADKAT